MTCKYPTHIIFFILLVSQFLLPAQANGEWRIENGVLKIDDKTDSIPAFQFTDNSNFDSISFSPRTDGSPLKIGAYAFLGCTQLRTLELPDFVDELGEGCFKECSGLRTLKLPENLKSTPRYMAAWCGNLSEVVFPDSIEKIGAHSFAYCQSIEKIDLPHTLQTIENNAFSRCTALTEIYIPDSVTALESYAFSDCTSLSSATLPANGSLLGELIFSGCESLQIINEPSESVPAFDCNSTLFEPDDACAYNRTILVVQPAGLPYYTKAPGWQLFKNIRANRE